MRRAFWWLVAAHVLLVLAVLPLLLGTHLDGGVLIGDETSYVDAGRALSNAVRDAARLGPFDTRELQLSVVSSGWFMPGMGVVLTPLFVVDPDASVASVRLYLAVVTTVLLVVAALRVRTLLGDPYALALLVFPGLVPMWAVFSTGAWGDLAAGLVLAVLVAEVAAALRRVIDGEALALRDGVRIGLVAVAMLYLRSSTSILAGALFVLLGLGVLVALRGAARGRSVAAVVVGGVCFLAVLAPWSIAASQTLGARVMTTTSVPTVLANTFGDRSQICFGPCDPGSTIWFTPLRYSREVARATGLSEVEVQRQMSSYARRDVTLGSYLPDVARNFRHYAIGPSAFSEFMRDPGTRLDPLRWAVVAGTALLYYPMLLVGIAVLVVVRRRPIGEQVLPVVLKVALACLLVQPFVHQAGSRYWPTAAPLVSLGLVMFVLQAKTSTWTWSRCSSTARSPEPDGAE
ncbi:hypothetical protein GCM10022215_43850 [Nocardioides fonticola]|uniref:Glycosyltransferase RgtA/B/C/D-like domain-containing protein n=1 Tax=Nocardioides fonticola TaxID=450363 RepID=A0ABP7Y4E8_9ACTN